MNVSPDSGPYQARVLAYARSSRYTQPLARVDAYAVGDNALCGDHLEVQLALAQGRIVGYAFRAEACVLVRAVAAMLGERLQDAEYLAVQRLQRQFDAWLRGDAVDAIELGELALLTDLRNHPARRKCARLPVATVLAALSGHSAATTEEA